MRGCTASHTNTHAQASAHAHADISAYFIYIMPLKSGEKVGVRCRQSDCRAGKSVLGLRIFIWTGGPDQQQNMASDFSR